MPLTSEEQRTDAILSTARDTFAVPCRHSQTGLHAFSKSPIGQKLGSIGFASIPYTRTRTAQSDFAEAGIRIGNEFMFEKTSLDLKDDT